MVSKPTLSQMVELFKTNVRVIGIIKEGRYESVPCDEVVKKFGDVEVKELDCALHTVISTRELAYNANSVGWVIHI